MAPYNRVYARLANRAVEQGVVDIETMIGRMMDRKVPTAVIEQNLMRDLEEGGPIFGKFFRSLGGAAESSVTSASQQAGIVGDVMARDDKFVALLDADRVDEALDLMDPDTMSEIETQADNMPYTWIALLQNTCHLCLPLHGQTYTKATWESLGLVPGEVHDDAGWVSKCLCSWVPEEQAASRADLTEPLRREKVGIKGSKKTQRAVFQRDIEKAQAAAKAAAATPEGRKIMQRLGSVGRPAPE